MEFLLGYKDDDNENDGNEESKREFTEDNEENTRKRKLKSTETPSKKIKLECSERASSSLKIKKNAQNPEEEENSNQSLGRIRIVPHIVGNYATFIYLPVKFNQYQNCHSKEIFKNTFSLIQKKLTTYLTRNSLNFTEDNLLHFTEEDDQYYKLSDINNITNTVNDATLTKDEKKSGEIGLHLSISSLIMLKKDQISRVVNGLRRALVIRKPIVVEFRNFEFFNNETKKRFFISLPVFNSTANEEINSLILGSNDVLKSFHLPTYNMDHKPHLSIGWSINEHLIELADKINNFDDNDPNNRNNIIGFDDNEMTEYAEITFDCAYCKVGKFIYSFSE